MNDPIQTCVVVAGDPAVSNLAEIARSAGGHTLAVVVGPRTLADAIAGAGVHEVVWCGEPAEETPVEAYAPEVARLVTRSAPRIVVGAATPAGRALLGAVAAATGAAVLSGITAVRVEDGRVVVDQERYGGIAARTLAVTSGPAVLAVDPGTPVAAGDAVTPVAPVTPVTVTPRDGVRITGTEPRTHDTVDLARARVVVGIGRGLKEQADLALIEDLAAALGAEIACSRPLAEGSGWVGKERYLGISGQRIAPELYLAIGISGQLQHMAGVRDARTVVAVNSDKNAPVFGRCDYGVIGDLYRIVPALTTTLKA